MKLRTKEKHSGVNGHAHRTDKLLAPIIDDAHLIPADCLRKLRLLCEDFALSHNLVLIGQPPLLQSLSLSKSWLCLGCIRVDPAKVSSDRTSFWMK